MMKFILAIYFLIILTSCQSSLKTVKSNDRIPQGEVALYENGLKCTVEKAMRYLQKIVISTDEKELFKRKTFIPRDLLMDACNLINFKSRYANKHNLLLTVDTELLDNLEKLFPKVDGEKLRTPNEFIATLKHTVFINYNTRLQINKHGVINNTELVKRQGIIMIGDDNHINFISTKSSLKVLIDDHVEYTFKLDENESIMASKLLNNKLNEIDLSYSRIVLDFSKFNTRMPSILDIDIDTIPIISIQ